MQTNNFNKSESLEHNFSVVITTKNSQNTIKKCIESVKSCSEIIVCDKGSTDKTLEIAKEYTSNIIQYEKLPNNHSDNFYAGSLITKKWFLLLNADEEVSTELLNYLSKYILQITTKKCLRIPVQDVVFGRKMHLNYCNGAFRFFKKEREQTSLSTGNELPVLNMTDIVSPKSPELIINRNFMSSFEDYLARINESKSLEFQKLKESNSNYHLFTLVFNSFGEFFRLFFINQGFRDGVRGLIMSQSLSFAKLLAGLQLCESNNISNQK